MARKKTKSDELFNQRRRAKRQIEKMKKELASSTGRQKTTIELQISALEKNIEKTYVKKRGQKASKENLKAGHVLDTFTKQKEDSAINRKNRIFQEKINTVSQGGQARGISESDVHIFYASTRKLWEGSDFHHRNELIIQSLGAVTLEEAFNIVMKKNKKARKDAKGQLKSQGFTDENESFYNNKSEKDEKETGSSPDYLDFSVIL